MSLSAAERILQEIGHSADRYHRLLLVAGRQEGAVSAALREVAARSGWPLLNLSLELSRGLLELPRRERPVRLHSLLEARLAETPGTPALLDHLELLFEPSLAQDPLRLLEQLSRSGTLVAAWPGHVEGAHLLYAEPGHPEHRRYPLREVQGRVLEIRVDRVTLAGS